MDWGPLLEWQVLPLALAVFGMLVLGAWLAFLDFSNRANRVFVLFLVLRAVSIATAALRGQYGWAGYAIDAGYWHAIFPYVTIPLPFVLVYFLSVYPHRRRWLKRFPATPYVLLSTVLILEVLYWADHAHWSSLAFNDDGLLVLEQFSWMSSLLGLMFFMFGVVTLVLARDYAREPGGRRRLSILVMCLGFAINGLFDGVAILTSKLGGSATESLTLNQALGIAGLIPLVAGLVLLARVRYVRGTPSMRREVNRFFTLIPIPVAAAVVATLGWTDLGWILSTGISRLSMPVLVTYALLRHQLFDIDARIKTSLKNTTIASVFPVVFFVVSEGLESFVPFDSRLLGIGAAGLIVLALQPIQRFAQRMAESAMPGVRPLSQMSLDERVAIYRDQARIAYEDGVVRPKERMLLDSLSSRLGLDDAVTQRLERRYAPTPGAA